MHEYYKKKRDKLKKTMKDFLALVRPELESTVEKAYDTAGILTGKRV